jgi:SH3-like domain-containing protein
MFRRSSPRLHLPRLNIAAAAWLMALVPAAVLAQSVATDEANPVQPPQVDNSKYQFEGAINASSVFVRSGPGENYYATQQLAKGQTVTVVGIKFDWLKIVPPDGSYSYVGSVFVDRSGDGSVGKINRNDVNVRAGSSLNAMKTTVQTRLNSGDQVQILGKEDEYLKIKPPADAYLYISKQFVDPVRPLKDGAQDASATSDSSTTQPSSTLAAAPAAAAPAAAVAAAAPIIGASSDVITTQTPTAPAPTTQPSSTVAAAATTQPTVAAGPPPSSEELFGKFENEYAVMTVQPLADQKIQPLITEYQSIEKAGDLSDTLKSVVQLRIATLQERVDSQNKLLQARAIEKANSEKELALVAEQQELAERVKQTEVDIYTAVGTLEPSSLQLGGATLYRLTDPATGRTVVYLRSSDQSVAGMMGQFVGVKGEATTDPQLALKVISPTDLEQVDPARVNGSIAAEIIPPSLMAQQASATEHN